MHCRDCVFFKTWKSFEAAVCEAAKKPAGPMDKPCEKFTPRGAVSEWGEKTTGGPCCR